MDIAEPTATANDRPNHELISSPSACKGCFSLMCLSAKAGPWLQRPLQPCVLRWAVTPLHDFWSPPTGSLEGFHWKKKKKKATLTLQDNGFEIQEGNREAQIAWVIWEDEAASKMYEPGNLKSKCAQPTELEECRF